MDSNSSICLDSDAPSDSRHKHTTSRLAERLKKLDREPVLTFVCERELKALLACYHLTDWGELQAQDNTDTLQSKVSASTIDPDRAPSTAPGLFQRLTWTEVAEIHAEIDAMIVKVSGMDLASWHGHVLRQWVGAPDFTDNYTEDYGGCPKVTKKHKIRAVTEFLKRLGPYL